MESLDNDGQARGLAMLRAYLKKGKCMSASESGLEGGGEGSNPSHTMPVSQVLGALRTHEPRKLLRP